MTQQNTTSVPQFFLTPAGPCPYLPGRLERKVFARLTGPLAEPLNEALTQSGFRRSQAIAYRPSCESCAACVSVRVLARAFALSRNHKRLIRRTPDIVCTEAPPRATREQFALLSAYLDSRHAGGGMSEMSLFDYAAMIEETPIATRLFEYRLDGALLACSLTDMLKDGLSMVYSFFHPGLAQRSLGTFMILDHILKAKARGLSYVYLGYWIEGSRKMAYKSRFRPLEAMTATGWEQMA